MIHPVVDRIAALAGSLARYVATMFKGHASAKLCSTRRTQRPYQLDWRRAFYITLVVTSRMHSTHIERSSSATIWLYWECQEHMATCGFVIQSHKIAQQSCRSGSTGINCSNSFRNHDDFIQSTVLLFVACAHKGSITSARKRDVRARASCVRVCVRSMRSMRAHNALQHRDESPRTGTLRFQGNWKWNVEGSCSKKYLLGKNDKKKLFTQVNLIPRKAAKNPLSPVRFRSPSLVKTSTSMRNEWRPYQRHEPRHINVHQQLHRQICAAICWAKWPQIAVETLGLETSTKPIGFICTKQLDTVVIARHSAEYRY